MPRGRIRASTTANKIAACSHPFNDISEFLRLQQGGKQINKQQNGQDNDDDGRDIHGGLPQLFTALDVPERNGKKGDGEEQSEQIPHKASPSMVWTAELPQCPSIVLSKDAG